jgi:RNA polymerase sigma-70 factor (ECF subfamily)
LAHPDDGLGDFARDLIRRKARQLARHAGPHHHDPEDVEQELTLRLLRAMPRYDPARGHVHAFVTAVVERAAAGLLRRCRAKKRGAGPVRSLDAPAAAEPTDRGDAGRAADRVGLAADLAAVLAELPADLRGLAERLTRQTLSEVARQDGVPRSTLQRRVDRLRRRFEDAGLREYL